MGVVGSVGGYASSEASVLAPRQARSAPASVVAAGYGHRDRLVRRGLAVGDGAAVLLSLVLALWIAGVTGPTELLYGALTLPVWTVLFKVYGLYDRDVKRISHTTVDDVPWLFHALLVGSLLLWLYFKALPTEKLTLAASAAFVPATLSLTITGRAAVRSLARWLLPAERVLLVGDGMTSTSVAGKLSDHPEYGLTAVGAMTHTGEAVAGSSLPVLGRLEDLSQIVRRYGVERVVISHTDIEEVTLIDLVHRCHELSLKVSTLPQLSDAMGPSVEIDDVGGVMVLGINPSVLPRSSRCLKRGMDLVVASVAVLALAPLAALIAVAIKLDSRGPVLFTQERVGKRGRRFPLLKFRTMVVGAQALQGELLSRSSDPHWVKLDRDPRVTRVGRLLRLTSLDELPQLWNVLRGEMSLVGPRPLIEDEDRLVGGRERGRLDLTPGITGVWQVLGRTRIPFEEMVKLDYLYVTNWSLWTDVRLIVRTLPAVVKRSGAN
jgi:exopolysaccharide biosynthesis polyprenyl glycosylphosphotransferase